MKDFNLESVTDYELGYLLGVYKGDGSATAGSHYMWRVNAGFDKEMVDRISGILGKLGIKHREYNDGRYWRLYVTAWSPSERLAKWLDEAYQNFHLASRDEKIGFLAGYYDSEGHLRKRPHYNCPNSIQHQIEISDTQLDELELVSNILTELDVQHSLKPKKVKENRLPAWRVIVTSRPRITRLLSILNPAIPRKASI